MFLRQLIACANGVVSFCRRRTNKKNRESYKHESTQSVGLQSRSKSTGNIYADIDGKREIQKQYQCFIHLILIYLTQDTSYVCYV